MKSARYITAVVSVLVCFVFDIPNALACSYIPYHGLERDRLPFSHGVKLKETPIISGAILEPPTGRVGPDCSGRGSFKIIMHSVDARKPYSGFIILKRSSGVGTYYLKKHFRNAHRMDDFRAIIPFTSREDKSESDVRFSYQVKFIDDKGWRTR